MGFPLFTARRYVYEVCIRHDTGSTLRVQPGSSPRVPDVGQPVISRLQTPCCAGTQPSVSGDMVSPAADKPLPDWLLTLGLAAAFSVSGLMRAADPGCPG